MACALSKLIFETLKQFFFLSMINTYDTGKNDIHRAKIPFGEYRILARDDLKILRSIKRNIVIFTVEIYQIQLCPMRTHV